MLEFIGIDGCKYGWFVVKINQNDWEIELIKKINELKINLETTKKILIDIPIGLVDRHLKARQCDQEARKLLGKRAASIFPAPIREILCADNYKNACLINREYTGKKISLQTWNLIPKIKELDDFLRNNKSYIYLINESHPELVFWFLNNKSDLKFSKKTTEGIYERLDILLKYYQKAKVIYNFAIKKYLRKDLKKDDIIDAISLATIGLISNNNLTTIPLIPEIDKQGLEMKIVYYEPKIK